MRLVITPGEPAGIGPDITLLAAQKKWPAELVVIADPDCLRQRAQQLGLPIQLLPFNASAQQQHQPGTLTLIPDRLATPCIPGTANPANAAHLLRCLKTAAQLCSNQTCQGLVTGPVHKGVINAAGIPFTGHTEFLAAATGAKKSLMLFVLRDAQQQKILRVALATTHLPLAKVPAAITPTHLSDCLRLLHTGLRKDFGLKNPHITVLGLNPHAGENGYLGREEIDIMLPVIEKLRGEGMLLAGPVATDTAFSAERLKATDALLAMYHDAALPVVKHMGQGRAVNVTLGLPIIRTSVDHGVALEIAGTGKADADSLVEAIHLALELAAQKALRSTA